MAEKDYIFWAHHNPLLGGGWDRYLYPGYRDMRSSWKIHVSATTPEAQNALVELARDHKLWAFKMAGPRFLNRFQDPGEPQSGKAAVFWHSENGTDGNPIDWKRFMQQAEDIVMQHGGPGPTVQHDRLVPGSRAVHYRNERGAMGEDYVPRVGMTQYIKRFNIRKSGAYNLAKDPDPFSHIDLTPPAPVVAPPPPRVLPPPTPSVPAAPATATPAKAEKPGKAEKKFGEWLKNAHGKTGGKIAIYGGSVALLSLVGYWVFKHQQEKAAKQQASPAPGQ